MNEHDLLAALSQPPTVVRPGRVDEILGLVSPAVRQGLETALSSRQWSAGAIRTVLLKAGWPVAESTLRRYRKDKHGV